MGGGQQLERRWSFWDSEATEEEEDEDDDEKEEEEMNA